MFGVCNNDENSWTPTYACVTEWLCSRLLSGERKFYVGSIPTARTNFNMRLAQQQEAPARSRKGETAGKLSWPMSCRS